jgi:hypothetical protein
MSNPMPTFIILRNRVEIGTVRAVSLSQAVRRAKGRYGRCEVIAAEIARHADKFHGADDHRTEGRAPCNNTEEGKARIEAIRRAAIAEWEANR